MQTEIKIVVFNPDIDPNHFGVDVYVNGESVGGYTGRANQSKEEAICYALQIIIPDLLRDGRIK